MSVWYKILVIIAFSLMLGLFIHETKVLKDGLNKWLWKNPQKRKVLLFAGLATFLVGLIVLTPRVM